jgi:hypothetical protein
MATKVPNPTDAFASRAFNQVLKKEIIIRATTSPAITASPTPIYNIISVIINYV